MSFMPKSDGELNPNNDASDRTSFEHEEEDEEEAARAKGADEAIGQMQALFVNNGANSVSFEQGEVAGQRPGAEDSNETTAVEEGSAMPRTLSFQMPRTLPYKIVPLPIVASTSRTEDSKCTCARTHKNLSMSVHLRCAPIATMIRI